MRDFDIIVVGAGPSGAASALKCSQLGYNTLLIEKGEQGRHKPCGGVLPPVTVDVLSELGLKIPAEVMCSPPTLGLFYVPPSGRKNGGPAKNYRLLNVNRDRFDRWLQEAAEDAGAKILYETEFLRFEETREGIAVDVKARGDVIKFSTRYLVGADGVFSKVKKQLYPALETETLTVIQEHWEAKGDFGEHFYAFFRGDVTPTYGYVIPKNEALIVGTGSPRNSPMNPSTCLDRFKAWLRQEFAFDPVFLAAREAAAVPYDSPMSGKGEGILVGDAAGFCNPLSGEGVRLAIESGIAAGEAIHRSEREGEPLSRVYAERVGWLKEFVDGLRKFAADLTDGCREDFVRTELARTSLGLGD